LAKGDVWLVDLPETVGHEQYGTRPAVVLAEITRHLIVIIVPISKNMKTAEAPYTAVIDPSRENGLSVPSVALGLQIRAVDKKRLLNKLGVLDSADLSRIDAELKSMLKL
jgi:mRNA interferase MazF